MAIANHFTLYFDLPSKKVFSYMSAHHEGYSVAEPETKANETTNCSEGIPTLCLQGMTTVHCKAQTFTAWKELKHFCLSMIDPQ